MQTKKLINAKPALRKSAHLTKLSIVNAKTSATAFAFSRHGSFIPMMVGTLQQVISDVEHCAAYYGLPVEHELNTPLTVISNTYQKVNGGWLWVRQTPLVYPDANAAYLAMRSVPGTIAELVITHESGNVKRTYTCSQHCMDHWEVVLHRLSHRGALPERPVKDGECPRCFSLFVKVMEGGDICLNCGHEQT